MSTVDVGPSRNGHGSRAWCESWTHLHVDRRSPGYCRVTFDHPPVNAITAESVAELAELVGLIAQDADLNVVMFDSANPRFYLGDHEGEGGHAGWADLLVQLARARAVSIASVGGRTGEAGREFVLACDLRCAAGEVDVDAIAVRLALLDRDALARVKAGADPPPPG